MSISRSWFALAMAPALALCGCMGETADFMPDGPSLRPMGPDDPPDKTGTGTSNNGLLPDDAIATAQSTYALTFDSLALHSVTPLTPRAGVEYYASSPAGVDALSHLFQANPLDTSLSVNGQTYYGEGLALDIDWTTQALTHGPNSATEHLFAFFGLVRNKHVGIPYVVNGAPVGVTSDGIVTTDTSRFTIREAVYVAIESSPPSPTAVAPEIRAYLHPDMMANCPTSGPGPVAPILERSCSTGETPCGIQFSTDFTNHCSTPDATKPNIIRCDDRDGILVRFDPNALGDLASIYQSACPGFFE